MASKTGLIKSPFLNILLYFLLATSISAIFRFCAPEWLEGFRLPYGSFYDLSLLVALGPTLAVWICGKYFQNSHLSLSFWGRSVWKSAIFLLVPILTVIYIGVLNSESVSPHLFALKVSAMWLLYIIGEEIGWRGYLQQLLNWNDYAKSLVIGFVWYIWHLSVLQLNYSFLKELFFIAILILGSFIMLKVTKRTESLAAAIGMHFAFSVLTNIRLPENTYLPIMFMCLTWLVLYLFWNKSLSRSLRDSFSIKRQ